MPKRNRRKRKRRLKGAVGQGRVLEDGGRGGVAHSQMHFTVGSIPHRGAGPKGGFFDFARELDLLKAALLYADRVKLCSVGASFMSALDDVGNMDRDGKLAFIAEYLPILQPEATLQELENTRLLMEAVKGARGGRGRGRFGPQEVFAARRLLDEGWRAVEDRVQEEYRGVGADGFREALRSGMVELQPFTHLSAEKLLRTGISEKHGLPDAWDPDETYDEYADRILDAVGDGETYPLFDDATGGIVGEAVRNGLIVPSRAAASRSSHGGLSGDLLRRLPLFERASVPEVLDIRSELAEHLDAFREAVAGFADAVSSASWDEDFADEAHGVFREKVSPAVSRIEQAVEDNRSMKGLSFRFGPPAVAGAASGLNAFLGSHSALGSLALLAAGAYTGVVAHKLQRKETEGDRLYFYYRAGTLLNRRGRARRRGRV